MGKGFKELNVWQESMDLAVYVYNITSHGDFKKDYGLRDQVRRSAVSVPSNLAEGDERDTDKDSVRFFYIAKGSLAELRTQIEIACKVGYIEQRVYDLIEEKSIKISKMLGALIKARSKKPLTPSP